MFERAFLASKYASGLSHVLPASPGDLRTVFVPTAGSGFESAPWIVRERAWFAENEFRVDDLELVGATAADVDESLSNAELVYVAGGNTYFLLHHMQRSRFWDVFAQHDLIYAGVSAGAIVCCPDISYIDDLDDRSQAPDLSDTTGAGVVDFAIMPHMDDMRARPKIDQILTDWPADRPLVKLNDDEAIVLEDGSRRVVSSPAGDLQVL